MASGPLDGVRILEFSIIWSGPFAGLHLSDMGADLIKVERPPLGDSSRNRPGGVPGHAKGFQVWNRGRRSLGVDLSDERGRELIHRLIPTIDVVFHNYRPGVIERLGIGYETLRAIRPDLIYGDISGYGYEGPLASHAASDIAASAYGGAVAGTGLADEFGAPVPNRPPLAGDLPTGFATALAIVAALYHRERTGEGQLVRTSLLRSVMGVMGATNNTDPVQDVDGRDVIRAELARVRESGGSYPELLEARSFGRSAGPYFASYAAQDGGLVLGALTPANRALIRDVLGIADQDMDDPGFDPSSAAGVAALDQRADEIRGVLKTRSVAEWIEALSAVGAPASPVNFPEELTDDPQTRTHYTTVEHPIVGTTLQVKPIFEMERSPTAVQGPAPAFGQHNEALAREAGYSDEAIAELQAAGVLASGA